MGTTTPIHDALAGALLELPARAVLPTAPAVTPSVTPEAERVVALAWREADERGHACFGTGHLLLALVRAEGPEAGLLAAAGVTTATAGVAMALVASSSVSEPVVHGGGDPVAGAGVAEVLEAASTASAAGSSTAGTAAGTVTASGLLTALLDRPWGQAAEMLAALGVDPAALADAGTTLAGSPARPAPRPMPRDPSGLLSSAWRRPVAVPADA